MPPVASEPRHTRYELLFAGLTALFVTFVVLTNTAGVKLFTLWGQPLPVSIVWYPLTFLLTDIISEIDGAARARFVVVLGFGMSVLLFASMAAYLLAQLIDVRLFHFWKRLTGGRHLWLRNDGSAMISQLVDTPLCYLGISLVSRATGVDQVDAHPSRRRQSGIEHRRRGGSATQAGKIRKIRRARHVEIVPGGARRFDPGESGPAGDHGEPDGEADDLHRDSDGAQFRVVSTIESRAM